MNVRVASREDERRLQGRDQPAGDVFGCVVHSEFQQDAEFVASEPRSEIFRPHACAHALGHRDE
jgi:hypothetical protein